MATTKILKEREDLVVFLIMGNATESNALVVDASTLSNPRSDTTFHHLRVIDVAWSISGTNQISLIWEGSPRKTFLQLAPGNFHLQLNRYLNSKLENDAVSANGDILITTTSTDRYSIVLVCEKSREGFNRATSYEPPLN
jgi:hypothetical protein